MNKKCPACESSKVNGPLQEYVDFTSQNDYTLFHCNECDIEFWHPLIMPPPEYYEQNTTGEYFNMHHGNELKLRSYHKLFIKKYEGIHKNGRILEIGCGDGRFLNKMQNLGWDITGLDFDKLSIENAIRKCNSNKLFHCNFDDFLKKYYDGNKYDLIVFFEVLEHQPNPVDFIANIKKIIKEDGVIAGSVPNRDRYIVSKRFSPDNPPHHFIMWTANSLKQFLAKSGFRMNKILYTRFEPIFIDQIINQLFWKDKQQLRKRDSSKAKMPLTFKQKVKRLINCDR
ncbi:MAG: class I SAM-dependent methyltransferase [Bacteroidales bacterium]|nr:class I SAM-dependent methyltransferase [Saprospiraceae bacterium]MCF8381922.1 class I SAM-dependent methyltransferase [Bacteroidales bacterium]